MIKRSSAAGGMSNGQQEQILDRLAPLLVPNKLQQKRLAELRPSKQELAEMWRTAASLERLPVAAKIRLGETSSRTSRTTCAIKRAPATTSGAGTSRNAVVTTTLSRLARSRIRRGGLR